MFALEHIRPRTSVVRTPLAPPPCSVNLEQVSLRIEAKFRDEATFAPLRLFDPFAGGVLLIPRSDVRGDVEVNERGGRWAGWVVERVPVPDKRRPRGQNMFRQSLQG